MDSCNNYNKDYDSTTGSTFFDLPPSNSTNPNTPSNQTFINFGATQNNHVNLNSQPLVNSSNPNMGRWSNHHQVGISTKNPKKRARASRRPPITVLTTNTTNFRQMVQEFTGISSSSYGSGLGLQQPCITLLNSHNPRFLFQESDNKQWKGANENLLPKLDEYELNTSNVHNLTHKGFETVILSGDDGDQAQGHVDSWFLAF